MAANILRPTVLALLLFFQPVQAEELRLASAVTELIQQLDSSNFEVRERAAAELLLAGPDALAQLKQFSADSSKELQQRAMSVTHEIERQLFIVKSRSFLTDHDVANDHGLPGWQLFRSLTGGSRVSKLLFLEMLKNQYPLAQQIQAIHHQRLLGGETANLQQQLTQDASMQAEQLLRKLYRGAEVGVGDGVALLLTTALMDGTVPVEISHFVLSTINKNMFEYLRRPGYKVCLQQLLACWIPKTHDGFAQEAMRVAYDLELAVVLPIARRHLSDSFDRITREYAIFCLAKFGDATDIAKLLSLTSDETVVHELDDRSGDFVSSRVAPPGLAQETQPPLSQKLVRINDLAAAAAMILLNEDPGHVFPSMTKESFLGRTSVGIAVDRELAEQRTQQIKNWATSRMVVPDAG